MIETRNHRIIKKIAVKYFEKSMQRNMFVIVAIILASFLLMVTLGIGLEFYNVTREQQVKAEGTSRDIIITNPKQEQIEIAESLDECEFAGIEARCAIAIEGNDKVITYGMYWKDDINWEKQTANAIEGIKGEYPQLKNEIMMSEWTLKELGYETYEVGMYIPLTYTIEKESFTTDFYLSGYFTDYAALLNPGSEKFLVSEEFYEFVNAKVDTVSKELGITLKNKAMTKGQMDKLEERFNLSENQGFFYNEELLYTTLILMITVILIISLIIFCSYLLVCNILYISFSKEVRTYGLLKTLGMTRKQMKKMLIWQVIFLLLIGLPLGMFLGGYTTMNAADYILSGMQGENIIFTSENLDPRLFIVTIIFTVLIVGISSFRPIKVVIQNAPLEAIKYNPIVHKRKDKKGKRGAKPYRMAIYNVKCNKRKSILVFLSLFMGITLFMVINTYTNSIDTEDYIQEYMPYDVILENQTRNDSGNLGNQIFTEDFLRSINGVEGVAEIEIVTSDTINVGFDEELFAGNYLRQYSEQWMDRAYEEVLLQIREEPLNFYGCLISVDKNQVEQLVTEQRIDMERFEKGEICLLQTDISIDNAVGSLVEFSLAEQKETYQIEVAGVVEENLSSYSGIAPNIYVSEKAVAKFVESPWIEKVNINYEESYDNEVENKIELLISDKNMGVSSRIKIKENVGNSKEQTSLVGNGLALFIAIIGILNFVNVIVTNICQRENDFKVLNSIGMTHSQIQKMLVFEGVIYGLGTIILVLTIGIAFCLGIFNLIKEPYMTLHFPYLLVGSVILMLLFICALFPILVYNRLHKRNGG